MSKKELKRELIQLFSDASEQYGETYEYRCIYDYDFDDLAQDVIKLFGKKSEATLNKARDL